MYVADDDVPDPVAAVRPSAKFRPGATILPDPTILPGPTLVGPEMAVARPGLGWLLTEPPRSALDLAGFLVSAPWLSRAPRGDGHPVFVLPGLLAKDSSTALLRRFLRTRGYRVHGWGLGRNVGPTAQVIDALPAALLALAERHGQPVSVIGWSLGGIFARRLARTESDAVRQVITLGSPFAMTDMRQSRAQRAFDRHSREHVHFYRSLGTSGAGAPVPVPATSIYSRRDGVVDWHACREVPAPGQSLRTAHENIEVHCSHLGFGHDPATLWAVADRLAQPADSWTAFTPPRGLRRLYPSPV